MALGASALSVSAQDLEIGVIVKTLSNTFWFDLAEGAKQAGVDDGHINVTVVSPSSEAAIEEQVAKVNNMVAAGVDAIVIAPLAPVQLEPALQAAVDAGITVVLVDTDIPGWDGKTAYVGTNNVNAAKSAGEWLAEQLGGAGKVGLINGTPGVTAVDDRIAGMRAGLADTDIEIVSELAAIDCLVENGVKAVENLTTAHPDVNAIFVACGPAAVGAGQAMRNLGMDFGEVLLVGYDAAPGEIDSIKAGEQAATVAQRQARMGGLSVEIAAMAARGETIAESSIDTGALVVTSANVQEYAPD